MIRKTKSTEITPRKEESPAAGSRAIRSPYDWFDEMDRWFDNLRRSFFGSWRPASLDLWGQDAAIEVREPLVDLVDEGREFLVKTELPGVSKEDVDLQITPEGIEIRAETQREREEKEKDYYHRERTYSSLHRSFSFPAEVLPAQAEATLKDGLLEVRVPKKEPTPEKKPVKVRVE